MTHQIDISNLFNPTTEESWLYKEYKKQTMAQQTPKEKAYELIEIFAETIEPIRIDVLVERNWNNAKQCALIAVDEILTTLNDDIRDLDVRGNILLDLIRYWRNVEEEIEKL